MPRTPIPLASESYEAATPVASIQRLVNLYAEANPSGSEFPFTLHSAPGLKLFEAVGSGPIRGLCSMGDVLFVVSGDELYAVSSNGTSVLVGTIAGIGAVRMTTNGVHVVICTSLHAYAATETTLIVLPQQCLNGAAYQDGYGVYTQAGTQNIWISGLDDLTSIDGLDFTTADASYDNVVGCISDHRELIVFKEKTTEIYNNTGASSFPFERSSIGFFERGCAGAGSIAKADNKVHWLGDDLGVYQMNGYQPQRISTPGIDVVIKSLASPETAEGFTLSYFGHVFYCLSFSDRALLFDITTGKWCERESYDCNGRWRANCCVEVWSKHIVGDFENGNLYEIDSATFDENSEPLIRKVVSPHITGSGARASMPSVEAIIEPGVGLNSGQGSDPQARLRWTDNDGRTWSNYLTAPIGQIGEYSCRTIWNRLGQFRRRSLELSISDPVKVSITGLYARVEGSL